MLGEVRLGFFVDGIGFYRDCSELIYKIDSNSNLKCFKEGEIIEIDESLLKIESVELAFIPYPGKKNFERQKPIKIVYVSKASALTGEVKIRDAIKLKDLDPIVELDIKEKNIKVDKGYTKAEFKEEFNHTIKPEKPKRTKRRKSTPKKSEIRGQAKEMVYLDEASFIVKPKRTRRKKSDVSERPEKQKKETKRAEPEKVKKTRKKAKHKAKATKSRTVKNAAKAGTVAPKKIKKIIKELDKPETKKHKRRARCKTCGNLFKNLARHKCKG